MPVEKVRYCSPTNKNWIYCSGSVDYQWIGLRNLASRLSDEEKSVESAGSANTLPIGHSKIGEVDRCREEIESPNFGLYIPRFYKGHESNICSFSSLLQLKQSSYATCTEFETETLKTKIHYRMYFMASVS
ncbi:hypothetical protein L1987_42621 [Smallanthus sonchifolius]|uniref:Uncharacterized protein n=1 Tax=Smallanthus sonchifolius TaxID=185202 RepID=A0ACB9GLD4_9ASTR|nr:hypothetical protein L1987_42621 [Smallanthus sonchifolius]